MRPARIVALLLPLVLCGCGGWQSAMDAHGTSALHLRQLILFIVAVCSVVWMLVMIALVVGLVRRRGPRPDPAAVDIGRERRMTVVVVCAVAATAMIVGVFTVTSFLATRAIGVPSDADLTIKVRGLQWWWGIEYFGDDPTQRFETANEIYIPVGRPVRLQLEGVDVIHSFWVPSLAGKQDLIPGRSNMLSVRAERPGVYRGQCAEFCGLQHAHMSLFVVAVEPEQFEAWLAQQRAAARPPADDEIAAGQAAFMAKPCAACHTIRGTAAAGANGPDLTHVGSRRSIAAGLFDTTRGSLAAWIADPQTLKPGNNMPMVPLSPDELRAISAYMASLQ